MATINTLDIKASTESPEFKTIKECTPQLERALTGCDRNLVHFLEKEGFITTEVHDQILNLKSVLTEAQTAGELVKWIRNRVNQDPGSFQVLVSHLQGSGNHYKPIADMLEMAFLADNEASPSKDKDYCEQPNSSSLKPGILKEPQVIIQRYNSYANYIQTSIEQQVTVKQLRGFLMGLSAFSLHSERSGVLLSDGKFEKAEDIDDIFEVLHNEYATFLNFGIMQTLQENYVQDKGQEELQYPVHLKAYVEMHTIHEILEAKPHLGKPTTTSAVMTFKFDITLTSRLSTLKDLERGVCKILKINPSGLQLLDVEKGSVLVTFLIVNSIARVIFTGEKSQILTQEQIKQFECMQISWLKCNGYEWNFSAYQKEQSKGPMPRGRSITVSLSGWKANALDFHNKVVQEVERLITAIGDESAAKKACELLKKAQIPRTHGSRLKMTPEQYVEKANRIVALLKSIKLTGPAVLQPPLMKEKSKRPSTSSVGRLPSARLEQLQLKSTVLSAQYQGHDIPVPTNQVVAELGKGNAIPLCFPNDMEWDQRRHKSKRLKDVERTSLILNPHALEILRSISGPVCVIAIVGPCRSGKSYILSRLISSAGVKAHFDLGHEMDPKTMGIWMWDQPFKMKLPNYHDSEVTIILLDTEGIDAANATDQGDSQIFTLSVLLSSLLIYNSVSVPKRQDLNQMNFVANISKSIQVQAGKSAVGEEGIKVADSNPRFMWLLRDVILMPTDKKGKGCHIKDHLLQKVLVEDSTDDEAQKGIRQCILSFFSAFDAEALPPPSTDPHVMRNIENPLYQNEISAQFLQQAEYVKKRIFNNCAPKKGFSGGSVVSGFQLAHMVELYVDALNSPGGVPVIGSTWQRVLETTYTHGMESAVATYKKVMEKAAKLLPMESEELSGHHRKGVDEMIKTFKGAASLDSEREVYEEYLNKLMAMIAVYDEDGTVCSGGLLAYYLEKNYGESKSACQALVSSLEKQHLDPLTKNLTPETDFNAIEEAFKTLIAQYSEECIGPASDDVLNVFVQNQEKQQEQLESQLSTIKNYDNRAKQRMKELEQSWFEQKEIEMKLRKKQLKGDEEAKLQAMTAKVTKDAETIRQANAKAMEDQEKRLQNMIEANLHEFRKENNQQMKQLRTTLEQRERELQKHNQWILAEMHKKQQEAARLRQQEEAAKQKRKGKECSIM